MDHDKGWIDLRYSDFKSFVDMVESVEVVQHREDILRINLKVFAERGHRHYRKARKRGAQSVFILHLLVNKAP